MTGKSGGIRYSTGCPTEKRSYASRKEARRARRHLTEPLSVYPCELCTEFHLGHAAYDVKRGNIARAAMRPKIAKPADTESTGDES